MKSSLQILAVLLAAVLPACEAESTGGDGVVPPDASVDGSTDGATDASDDGSTPATCQSYFDATTTPASGTIYYVSAEGDDASDGTSPETAWRSIAKVNATPLVSGDVVLFRCGDQFTGQLEATTAGVTYDAYGSVAQQPIISGAEQLTGWAVHEGSVYVTQASGEVQNLLADGVQMTLARFPNEGFVPVESSNGSTTVTAADIARPADYWIGANLRLRSNHFVYEHRPVTAFDGTTVTLADAMDYTIAPGWGFYLDNQLAELDAPGEWSFDATTGSVYFYAPGGVDPTTLTVDASVWDYGITGSASDVTVRGLDLRYQAAAALWFKDGASNIQVLSNHISGQWLDGVRIDVAGSGCVVDSNHIEGCNAHGIVVTGQSNVVSNNTLARIGMTKGYGHSGTGGAVGILTWDSSELTIRGNSLESTGYIGIAAYGTNHLVENNVVKNTMQTLADGGGIYAYGEDGLTYGGVWRHNIIEGVLGNIVDAMPAGEIWWTSANGLYLDYGCHDMTVEGNTVIGATAAGIFIQYNDRAIEMRDNVVYDSGNGDGHTLVQIIQDTGLEHGELTFERNTLYSTATERTLFYVQQNDNTAFSFPGALNDNYYCAPYVGSRDPFMILTHPGEYVAETYTLASWQATFGQDEGSHELYTQFESTEHPEKLFVNYGAASISVDLSDGSYRDLDGSPVTGPLELAPCSSRLLVQD